MSPHAFFAAHSFFRKDELVAAFPDRSQTAIKQLLNYHVRTGAISKVRRGVYAVENAPLDELLLPSKLCPEAVLAYDGAAVFHGIANDLYSISYFAPRELERIQWGEVLFRCIVEPAVADPVARFAMCVTAERHGHTIAATPLERTIVDCFDRVDRGMPPEWLYDRLLFTRPRLPFDADRAVAYALAHASPLGCARLGLLLEVHPGYRDRADLRERLETRLPSSTRWGGGECEERDLMSYYFRRWRLVFQREYGLKLVRLQCQ
jgi:hypothetical protein